MGIVLIVSGVCAGISAITAWWSIGLSGPTSGSIDFLPGSSAQANANGSTETQTYASAGLGSVGNLYEGLLAACIIAMILCLVAGILAVLTSLGKARPPRVQRVVTVLGVFAIVSMIAAVAAVTVAQPTLLDQSRGSFCSGSNGTQSPCNSFWGYASSGGESVGWGADVGWYLAIAVAVLTLAGLILWRSHARSPVPYLAAPSPGSWPAVAPGAGPAPVVPPSSPPPQTPPTS